MPHKATAGFNRLPASESTASFVRGENPMPPGDAHRIDRRAAERFPFSSKLEVRHASKASSAVSFEADALDVSTGGFGFRSSSPLSVGDLIDVSLPDIGDDPSLRIIAIVRHVVATATPDVTGGGIEWVVGAERAA
jgi:hypothetical protein